MSKVSLKSWKIRQEGKMFQQCVIAIQKKKT